MCSPVVSDTAIRQSYCFTVKCVRPNSYKIQNTDLLRTGTLSWLALNSARLHNMPIRARAIQLGSLREYTASEGLRLSCVDILKNNLIRWNKE